MRHTGAVTEPTLPEEAPQSPRPPAAERADDPGFETLWQHVLEAWDDDKAHVAALEYALRTENLPLIAGRYRQLKGDPLKGERAQKRLDAIILAATQLMMSMKTPPQTKVPLPITLSAFGIFLFALAFLIYAMMRR
jgi:hypothetical protein